MPVFLNLDLMFLQFKDFNKALAVHSHRSCLSTLLHLFTRVQESLICLKAVLNGLKQDTSRGCRAWEVWEGKEMMSSPAPMAIVTTSKVT
jgi:hypothetical protein